MRRTPGRPGERMERCAWSSQHRALLAASAGAGAEGDSEPGPFADAAGWGVGGGPWDRHEGHPNTGEFLGPTAVRGKQRTQDRITEEAEASADGRGHRELGGGGSIVLCWGEGPDTYTPEGITHLLRDAPGRRRDLPPRTAQAKPVGAESGGPASGGAARSGDGKQSLSKGGPSSSSGCPPQLHPTGQLEVASPGGCVRTDGCSSGPCSFGLSGSREGPGKLRC